MNVFISLNSVSIFSNIRLALSSHFCFSSVFSAFSLAAFCALAFSDASLAACLASAASLSCWDLSSACVAAAVSAACCSRLDAAGGSVTGVLVGFAVTTTDLAATGDLPSGDESVRGVDLSPSSDLSPVDLSPFVAGRL